MPSSCAKVKNEWSCVSFPLICLYGMDRDNVTFFTLLFSGRLQSLHGELEQAKLREGKLTEDNRQLSERVSSLEKECASLSLELKAAENRYQQEVRAHEETERSRLVSKEEANLEVVKGEKSITEFIRITGEQKNINISIFVVSFDSVKIY